MNQIIVTGRIVKKPELKNSNGKDYTQFAVACKRGKDATDFINFTAFDHTAKYLADYAEQGYNVTVSGTVRQDKFEKDGATVSRYSFIANDIDIAFPPKAQ